jgi:hypothetical protein
MKPFHYFTSNQLRHVLKSEGVSPLLSQLRQFSTGTDKPVSLASLTEKEKSCPKHVYELRFFPFNLHYSFGFTPATEKYISPIKPSILIIQKSCL